MRLFPKNNEKRRIYYLHGKDLLLYGSIGGGLAFVTVMIFYHDLMAAGAAALVMAVFFPWYKRKDIYNKQKKEITWEFKESLYSLQTRVRAGESMESAFESTVKDMDREMFPYLRKEWNRLVSQMKLHQRLEELLKDFGRQTGIDEIQSFADILAISKRTKGDITAVIENTSLLLQEKIEMQQELEVLLAKKKTEQRIMNLMPVIVIAMLTILSPEYVAPLYTTLQGRIIMTGCVLLAVLSVILARRIADIPM